MLYLQFSLLLFNATVLFSAHIYIYISETFQRTKQTKIFFYDMTVKYIGKVKKYLLIE